MDKEEIVSKLKEIQAKMSVKSNEISRKAEESYSNNHYDDGEFFSGAAIAYLHYFSVVDGLLTDIELAELGGLPRD